MAEKKKTEAAEAEVKEAAQEAKPVEEKLTLTYSDLQKMIAAEIAKHDAEKEAESVHIEASVETEEQKKKREYYNEKVVINLFLDNDKYKDDVIVNVNGKAWQIQRGVDVEVPRYVAKVIENSMKQDRATALRIRSLEEEYKNTLK